MPCFPKILSREHFYVLLHALRPALFLTVLLFFFVLCPQGATAAQNEQRAQLQKTVEAADQPMFWTVHTDIYENNPILRLNFVADEMACRKAYGDDWRVGCSRNLNLTGRPARGIRLTPPLAGEWRWSDNFTLVFRPFVPWLAGQAYTINLAELPASMSVPVRLTKDTLHLEVPSLAAEPSDYGFKRNPEKLSDMVVTGKLRFNHAVVEADVPGRLTWRLMREGKELSSGPVTEPLIWDGESQRAVFNVPVKALQDQEVSMLVELADGYRPLHGGQHGEGTVVSVLIPGRDSAFSIEDVRPETTTNARLAGEQQVYVTFSLAVNQQDVQPRISARLLPRDRVSGQADKSPYTWQGLAEVTPEILAQSTPLELDSVAPAIEGAVHGYRLNAEPGRAYVLTVQDSLPGPDGLKLSGENTFLVQVPSLKPELKLLQDGAVLALTGDKTLSIYSRGLDKVQWKASRVRPEYLNHLISQSSGSFASPTLYGIDITQLASVSEGSLPLVRKDEGSPQFAALDLAPLLAGDEKGLFYLTMSGENAGRKICESAPRFVLVTDLGLIYKKAADGRGEIYAASLSKAGPASGARIRVLGSNGLPVFEGVSDANGRVELPSLDALTNEKKPVVITAEAGKDLSFLPFSSSERILDTSSYSYEGRSSASRLNAYLFSERGVYRPGEPLRFGAFVKDLDWNPGALDGLPLTAILHGPGDGKPREKKVRVPATGLAEITWDLPENAPTGTYSLMLCLADGNKTESSGTFLDSLSVQVREFLPDSMRLTARFDPPSDQGWLKPDNVLVRTALRSLHGSAAQDRQLRAVIRLSSPIFYFSQHYKDWNFFDAAPTHSAMYRQNVKETLPEQRTDENGEATHPIDLNTYAQSSFLLEFEVQGFEAAGGRAVTERVHTLVSPLDFVVGTRTDANLSYLRMNGTATVDFLAIGPDLKPRDAGKLRFETLAVESVKALVRDSSGSYRHDMVKRERPIANKSYDLPASGLSVPLDLSTPGDFILIVRNEKGVKVACEEYSVAGNAAAQFGADRAPTLRLKIDKADYEPGEEIEVSLGTPYKGAGLITIERDRVVARTWFKAEAGDSVQRIRLPKSFEGRGYVNVAFFRALDSKDIFTKPLASAVSPFTVGMKARDMDLKLEAPQKVRPGETLNVDVRAVEKGKAVLFAVDEGILQLTRYVTPNPLKAFLTDRALEVRTTQMFDLLMPEYSLLAGRLSVFGGGDNVNLGSDRLNPFKRKGEPSTVFWSGVIDVGPDSTRIAIPVPPWFNGSLRVMAVAASEGRVGAARIDSASQADVTIMPNFPLVVAPGDEFDGNIALTNTTAAPLTARLNVETGAELSLIKNVEVEKGEVEKAGQANAELTLPPGKDVVVRLRFRAQEKLGNAVVRLAAQGDGFQTVERPVTLSVRPATPATTIFKAGWVELKPGASLNVPLEHEFYDQRVSTTASVSALPLPALYGLSRFLQEYPYACTEQIVSGAFPSLLFLRYPQFAPSGFDQEKARTIVLQALDTIETRNNDDYDFLRWSSGSPVSEAVQAYIADFLTTVQEAGVDIRPRLKNGVLRRLRENASRTPWTLEEGRARAYAAWVLTRNGVVTTNILAGIAQRLDVKAPTWRNDVTATLVAGSWKLLHSSEAQTLLSGYRPQPGDAWKNSEAFFNPLTERALHLTVLAGQFPDRLGQAQARVLVRDIVTLVNAKRYVTTSASLSSRALLAFTAAMPAAEQQLTVQALDKNGNSLIILEESAPDAPARSLSPSYSPDLHYVFTAPQKAPGASLGGFWQVEARGFLRQPPKLAEAHGLELTRTYIRPDGTRLQEPAGTEQEIAGQQSGKQMQTIDTTRRALTGVAPGDEIVVELKARSYGREVRDVALVDLLPGGFEQIQPSVESSDAVNSMEVDRVEHREDRLLAFVTLHPEPTVFRYRIRATSGGLFTLPNATLEAMYDSSLSARTAAGLIEVK